MPSLNSISPDQLFRLIGGPNAPVVLDVRLDADVADAPFLVPTARRCAHDAVSQNAEALRGRRVVALCQKGRKLSQGAAALLRTLGVSAEFLEGGDFAWRDAGLPRIPISQMPTPQPSGETLWVARHRPKIDRIACPWLIRRFVDPSARFLFVAPSEVAAVAERFEATPFDIEGAHWSHRGERCTFDAMIEDFGLETEALRRLATVVRGADTNRHDLAPQASGLLAISVGLSRLHRDDLRQLDAGMLVYDALYRWARDGFEEGHDWPNPGSGGDAPM